MNRLRIMEWLAGKILALGITGLDERGIDYGNSAFQRGGKPLWIRLRVEYGDRLPSAEKFERRRVVLIAEICLPLGIGIERGSALASKVSGILVPGDPSLGAVRTADGVRFYPVSVRQGEMLEGSEFVRVPVFFEMVLLREVNGI